MNILNLKNNIDRKKQPIWFGESLDLQRYDQFKYSSIFDFFKKQLGFYWRPEEVSLVGKEKTEHKTTISSMTDFIGQWDKRLWKKPINHHVNYGRDYVWKNPYIGLQDGFVNRNRLELYTRHTHIDGTDQAYKFGYMFRVDIPIQLDVHMLILPRNPNVYIFSGFVSENMIINDATYLGDKYDF